MNSRTEISRRRFLIGLGAGGALAACSAVQIPPTAPSAATQGSAGAATAAAAAGRPDVVRLSSVVIPNDSGLYAALLPDFERRSGYKVEISTAQDVYGPARAGKADIVLSHYQHEGVSAFVQDGFGEWPRLVFSSPGALIGPPSDPAKVRGSADIVEAFGRISKTGSPFVVNDIDGLRYVGEVVWRAANIATTGSWYLDKGARGPMAMQAAVQSGGYALWGVIPFLRNQQQAKLPLEPLVINDQVLKSVMATIIVSEKKVAGINTKGAAALQQYLLEPATQAKVRTFRMAGSMAIPGNEQVWWPAAQDNEKAILESR